MIGRLRKLERVASPAPPLGPIGEIRDRLIAKLSVGSDLQPAERIARLQAALDGALSALETAQLGDAERSLLDKFADAAASSITALQGGVDE